MHFRSTRHTITDDDYYTVSDTNFDAGNADGHSIFGDGAFDYYTVNDTNFDAGNADGYSIFGDGAFYASTSTFANGDDDTIFDDASCGTEFGNGDSIATFDSESR